MKEVTYTNPIAEVEKTVESAISSGSITFGRILCSCALLHKSIKETNTSTVLSYMFRKRGYKLQLDENCFNVLPVGMESEHKKCSIMSDLPYALDKRRFGGLQFIPLFSLGFRNVLLTSIIYENERVLCNVFRKVMPVEELISGRYVMPSHYQISFPVISFDRHTIRKEMITLTRSRFDLFVQGDNLPKAVTFDNGSLYVSELPRSVFNIPQDYAVEHYEEFMGYVSDLQNRMYKDKTHINSNYSIVLSQRLSLEELGTEVYYATGDL